MNNKKLLFKVHQNEAYTAMIVIALVGILLTIVLLVLGDSDPLSSITLKVCCSVFIVLPLFLFFVILMFRYIIQYEFYEDKIIVRGLFRVRNYVYLEDIIYIKMISVTILKSEEDEKCYVLFDGRNFYKTGEKYWNRVDNELFCKKDEVLIPRKRYSVNVPVCREVNQFIKERLNKVEQK